MRCALVAEIAGCIVVVQVEAETEPFVGIHGKFCSKTVLAILLIAAVIVGDTRIGGERVHEEELIGVFEEETVRVGKDERTTLATVYKDSALTGCIVITGSIIFAVDTGIEDSVHEQMMHGIGCGRYNVTKLPVDCP